MIALSYDFPDYLLHPYWGWGYQFFSGIGSTIQQWLWLLGLAFVAWRTYKHMQCHVEAPKNCRRIGRPVAGTGHRACRLHHPHAEERGTGITAEDIARHHEEALHK